MKRRPNRKMSDFNYKEVKFWSLLKSTGKWKELFNQKESLISAIVSSIIMLVLLYLFHTISIQEYNELLKCIINIVLTTLVGMLGFIISGIAIFTGTITNKLISNIDSADKASSLIGILFSFYFVGAIIGIAIVVYILMYLFVYSNICITVSAVCIIGFLLSYLYIFSIFYSISLIGTCLKLFFVSYKFSDDKNENSSKKDKEQ